MIKIESSGFENAHYLKSAQRSALYVDVFGLEDALEHCQECGFLHFYSVFVDKTTQLAGLAFEILENAGFERVVECRMPF